MNQRPAKALRQFLQKFINSHQLSSPRWRESITPGLETLVLEPAAYIEAKLPGSRSMDPSLRGDDTFLNGDDTSFSGGAHD